MSSLLVRWLINAAALLGTAALLGNYFRIDGAASALVAAALWGIINAIIRPVLIVLTLPINIITLGLFTFVINAFMLILVAQVVEGVTLTGGFLWAVIVALILSIISSLISTVLGR